MVCPKCQFENSENTAYCGKCGTKFDADIGSTKTYETPTQELTTGSTFAKRYQIIEELGKGGMGRVYKVLDKETHEKIALKLIKPEIATDKKTIERFRNELTTARKIGHKNVCRMFDLNKEKGNYYITMEYISGQDLKGLIRQTGQLTVGKAISIAKQICDGLTEAHSLSVVHRDLKPNNIMIDRGGNAKIMDFGIARAVKGKSITGSGVMIGTPQYMSPEQVEGKDVDQRSDIYSLGILLYEMLTDRVPFKGDTPITIGVKQKTETPNAPKTYNERIPDDLNRLILKCLEKERENRYQNVTEVRSDLEKLEQGLPTTDRVIPKKKTLISEDVTVTFKKRWVLIALPLVIILAVVLAFLIFNKGKELPPQHNPKIIVLPFENLSPGEEDIFAVGIAEGIRTRLSVLHGLDVVSRDTAVSYKNTEKTTKQITNETHTDYILRGTVAWDRKEGDKSRVRIRPYLIQTIDDTQIWSDEIDRDIQDFFAVESEIAEQVTRELDLFLLPKEIQALEARPTENLEAYKVYLSGLDYWRTRLMEESLQLAIQMFERTVMLDPEFALAYCYLSMCHSLMYHFGYDISEERKSKAKATVDRVHKLQPELPELHSALGAYYYLALKDYDRALAELSIAEKDLPNDAIITEMIGYIRRRQGDFGEAIRLLKRSLELNPQEITVALDIGGSQLALRNFPEAEHYFDLAISLDPWQIGGYIYKALTYLFWSWDIEKASDVIESMPLNNNPLNVIIRYIIEMVKEDHQAAIDILSTVSFESFSTPVGFFQKAEMEGMAYAAMGKMDLAQASFDSARLFLEDVVKEFPQDPRIHIHLGRIYAVLGHKEEALREGSLAMEICTVSMDAVNGPQYVNDFAEILVRVGEYEEALDKIDFLLSIPFIHLSVASLRNDPIWKPLHDHPRFKQLLEKYSK